MRSIRAWWLLIAFLSGMALAMFAEDLILTTKDNRLELSAPHVHFLTGAPLARLRNAAEVPFDFQVTLWSGSRDHVLRRTADRFVVSFDIWEQSFAISKLQGPRRSTAHLSAQAAEAWCWQQLSNDMDIHIGDGALTGSERLWARVDIRAQAPAKSGDLFGRGISDSGISLSSLIEIFSRPAQAQQPHWTAEAGPITVDQLRRHGRGS
jgi:hypothetical protein